MEEDAKIEKANYLISCGLALVSSAFGLALTGTMAEGLSRNGVFLVAAAALALFGFVVYRARGAEGEDDGIPTGRLRKMTILWLALTVVTGVGMARGPVADLISGEETLSARAWIALFFGAAFTVIAVGRGIWTLRLWRRLDP